MTFGWKRNHHHCTVKVVNISSRCKNMKVEINFGHIKEFQILPFEQKLCN